jgi:large repetitive protein
MQGMSAPKFSCLSFGWGLSGSAVLRVLACAACALLAMLLLAVVAGAQAASVFPQGTAVGQSSAPMVLTLTLTGSGVSANPIALTQGIAGGDFVLSSGGTCVGNVSYSAGDTCTVQVVFQPTLPGLRRGAVILTANDGTLLVEGLVSGMATGSLEVLTHGRIDTVAGNGAWIFHGDGVLATQAPIFLPTGIVTDLAGNLYLADSSNNRIRRVDAGTGLISTVAGNGTPGYSGDGGAATAAMISAPGGLALDGAGNLYFADTSNQVVRRVDAVSGVITTVAGTPGVQGYGGDGIAATSAKLSLPEGIALDAAGNLLIADTGNQVVRRVDAVTGLISTLAGIGVAGYSGDGVAATSAELNSPWNVAVGGDGTVYIADLANNRVRAVSPSGTISTVAGMGVRGFSGDGDAATSAELNAPAAVALDPAGNIYIADSGNNRVRRVNAQTGNMETLSGTDSEQFQGDTGPANLASMYGPYALDFDGNGNLFVSDMFHNRVRRISASAISLTFSTMRVGKVSSAQPLAIENDGSATLTFAAPQLNNAAVDGVTTTCAVGSTLSPSTLCMLGVEFAPQMVGDSVGGTLAQPSDAGNSPVTVSVSGQVLSVEPTSVALTSSGSPSLINGAVTFTAAVTSDDPSRSGPVRFFDGTTLLCSATLNAGVATCTVSTLALGTHGITAAYGGDNNNAASTSPVLTQSVQQLPTLTLSVLPNPAVVTSSVTLAFTATAASGTPSGVVTFFDGETALGSASLNASGAASLSTSQLLPGTHQLSAQYAGDGLDAAGQSNVVNEVIQQASATTELATSAGTATVGSTVVLTATVSSANGPVPTGTVQWMDGTASLGSAVLNSSGVASLSISVLAPGVHSIVASYLGDTDDAGSASAVLEETIQQIGTTTAVTSDSNPANAGGIVHLTAVVSLAAGATADGVLTGQVNFVEGGVTLGSAVLDASGHAVLSLSTLGVGTHNIAANYMGAANYALSSSAGLQQVVQQTATTTALNSSAANALAGMEITLSAGVTSATGTPTGTVSIRDGGVEIAQVQLNAADTVSFTTASLAVGTHQLTAVYLGDSNYGGSTSSTLQQAVALATATLTLVGPTSAVDVGTVVTVSGALSSSGLQPTGTLILRDGSTAIATQAVGASTGVFSFSTTALALGAHALSVTYSGDADNAAAVSPPVSVTVQQAPTATALTMSGSPAVASQPVTLNAAVASDSTGATGTVAFFDGSTPLGSAALGANGSASLTTSALALGAHSLTAQYGGDRNHAGSTSPVVSERVVLAASATLSSSVNPVNAGAPLKITALISGSGAVPPSGTVVLKDGAAVLATVTLDGMGTASFSTTELSAGVHTISLSYAGDANYAATSATLLQTVQNASTQIALTASANPATYAQPVVLTAAITSNGGVATGSVSFTDGSVVLGGVVLDSNGAAVLTLKTLGVGAHQIVANYAGDGRASASVSGPMALVVKQTTAVALTTNANPAQTLSSVVLTATVTGSGAGVPAGVVSFADGSVQLGTATLDANGQAALAVPAFAAGSHSLMASYAGDATDFASASQALAESVQLRATTTTLSGTQTDASNPQQVTLIGVVHTDGTVAPTGGVTFTSGPITLGVAPVDGTGVAAVTVLLEGGTQNIVASYGGDSAYASSSSGATPISGGAATQFTLQVSSSNITVVTKQHIEVNLTVASVKGFSDTLQFGCLGLPVAATCTFSTPQVKLAADGTASVQLMVDTGDPLGAGAQAGLPSVGSPRVLLGLLTPGGLIGLLLWRLRSPKKLVALLMAVCAVGLAVTLGGCSSGLQTQSTPPGTYMFKVTASGQGSGATQSQAVTLAVTQ